MRRRMQAVDDHTIGWVCGVQTVWRKAAPVEAGGKPPSEFSPISSLLSLLSAGTGRQAAYWLVYVCWWLHLLILLAFLLYVPQSKRAHLLFVPFDIVLSGTGPHGRPCKLDFSDETAEEFGVGKIEHFTKGQLLDLYACVECGRCTNMWR
ncbi:hypothetical protein PN4B1_02540 [Paenibacillus naphthalenovorans]|uniref:hypothetical protein n=1 Tax=Paenibacillus naphthalenovorans TaxID=162209 RepID=UPI0010B27953|nr:hypothetical protein [Paenibacillus naphthalenovorans]GCL70354.1 hypothetical protein PN4B1_02540 [Paenibacillus naphthalenovorans]